MKHTQPPTTTTMAAFVTPFPLASSSACTSYTANATRVSSPIPNPERLGYAHTTFLRPAIAASPFSPIPVFPSQKRQRHSHPGSVVSAVSSSSSSSSSSPVPSDGSDLLPALRDEGTSRQALAFYSLVELGGSDAVALLHASGALYSDVPKVRIGALQALGKLITTDTDAQSSSANLDLLISVLRDDKDHSVRAAAASGLSNVPGNPAVAEALRQAVIKDDHFIVRYSAIVALGDIKDIAAVSLLLPLIQNPHSPSLEIASAVDAVGEILDDGQQVPQTIVRAVLDLHENEEDLVRAAVVRTLFKWKSLPDVANTLANMERNEVKFARDKGLGTGQSTFVLQLLQSLLDFE